MDQNAKDALVTGYTALIPSLNLPDPDDRHVLAATIVGQADVIVTHNIKDFPESELEKYGIEAQHPDHFIRHLLDLSPILVADAICDQLVALKNPPYTMGELKLYRSNSDVIANADLILFLILLGVSAVLLNHEPLKSEDAIATLIGALLGAAALLLGNWIARRNDRIRAEQGTEDQRSRIKAIIAAELVNVAAGLIGAKRSMDAAVGQVEAGGHLTNTLDLSSDMPRPMPFTDALGTQLSSLDFRDLDVLATLRANLTITARSMSEVSAGKVLFGEMTARRLRGGVAADMEILAQAFEQFAPARKLDLGEGEPVVASVLLRQLAK